jgi:hypothetical protein
MAEVLAGLIGPEAQHIIRGVGIVGTTAPPAVDDLDYWEHKLENLVISDPAISPTEKKAIIRACRGQGLFK